MPALCITCYARSCRIARCLPVGSSTRLLRSAAAPEAHLAHAADYAPRLQAAGITLCAERRADDIWAGAQVQRRKLQIGLGSRVWVFC